MSVFTTVLLLSAFVLVGHAVSAELADRREHRDFMSRLRQSGFDHPSK